MDKKEALRHVGFLRTLPEEAVTAIAAAGREQRLQQGEMLFTEATPCLGLIVVMTGAIKIHKLDDRGRELTLGVEGPGGSVAELPLFDGGAYPAGAEAAEDGTTVLIVPRDRFRQLMATHPQIAEEALRALARRMRALVQRVEAQTLHSVQARLAAYLLRVADGRTTFPLTETNEAIAGQIGTVRDVVSRTLGGFREAGVISRSGRQITIHAPDALRHIARQD